MAKVFARFSQGSDWFWGRIAGDDVFVLDAGSLTTREFLLNLPILKEAKKMRFSDLQVLGPVTHPCAIVCQGKNYLEHMRETGTKLGHQDFDLFFSKASSSLTDPFARVEKPTGVELLDYELELGIVIGRDMVGPIGEAEAQAYIGALVMTNDVSARDVQIPEGQWFHGKSFRGFCPNGPFLVVPNPEEMHLIETLELKLWVNGQLRQNSVVKKMIHAIPKTIAELSQFMNLRAGDLLMTGTPSGVAMNIKQNLATQLFKVFASPKKQKAMLIKTQLQSGRYLQIGDQIKSQIQEPSGRLNLGEQLWTVVATDTKN